MPDFSFAEIKAHCDDTGGSDISAPPSPPPRLWALSCDLYEL